MLKDRKTGCSISPIFIRHQGIPVKDKHFEYSQLREIFPAVGTKEPNPKTWLCRKGAFCCSQTDFFIITFSLLLFHILTQRRHGETALPATGPERQLDPPPRALSALVHYSSPAALESCITPSVPQQL